MGKLNNFCWEDTVFEHRNREYGAYLLRYSYPFYLTVSALIVIILFLAGMVGLQISNGKKLQIQEIKQVRVINYNELSAPPPIERIYVPPPATEKVVVQQEKKIEKHVAPVVVQEEVVEPEEEMMTMEEIRDLISSTGDSFGDFEGVETVVVVAPQEQVIVVGDYKEPEFPGGREALMKWLENHLKYPSVAKRMGIEGKVVVEFIVNENGKISGAEIKESLHRLCDKEALRLVNSMPDWIPGERNSVKARLKYTLSVPFVLE